VKKDKYPALLNCALAVVFRKKQQHSSNNNNKQQEEHPTTPLLPLAGDDGLLVLVLHD